MKIPFAVRNSTFGTPDEHRPDGLRLKNSSQTAAAMPAILPILITFIEKGRIPNITISATAAVTPRIRRNILMFSRSFSLL